MENEKEDKKKRSYDKRKKYFRNNSHFLCFVDVFLLLFFLYCFLKMVFVNVLGKGWRKKKKRKPVIFPVLFPENGFFNVLGRTWSSNLNKYFLRKIGSIRQAPADLLLEAGEAWYTSQRFFFSRSFIVQWKNLSSVLVSFSFYFLLVFHLFLFLSLSVSFFSYFYETKLFFSFFIFFGSFHVAFFFFLLACLFFVLNVCH